MASNDYKVDYAEITRVYRLERKDALSDIPSDFYGRAREYIESLESAEKESGEENRELLQAARTQIREARKLIGNIWEFRTRKLALMAVSQRKSGTIGPKGLAAEEMEFFNNMVESIRQHEESSLRSVTKKETARKAAVTAPVQKETAGEKKEDADAPPKVPESTDNRSLVLVRFSDSVPTFATEYGEFEVRREDVAFLPEAYARVLIDRKVAVAIKGQ